MGPVGALCIAAGLAWAAPVPASRLEAGVESLVASLRRAGRLSPDERTSWVVYDFTSDRKLASINEDVPFDAASLIKPLVALAYLHEVERGRLRYTSHVRRRMEDMIQHSDNEATNWMMRRLGGPAAVDRILAGSYGRLLPGVRIVEYIPPGGRTYRNKATAHDYSRFLYALWRDGLPRAAELRRLMHLPNRDRLYSGARRLPPATRVYDKTGSTARLCGNIGVLEVPAGGRSYPYIVVGLIQKERATRRYGRWIRSRGDVIRRVSDLIYESLAARHGLSAAAGAR